MDARKTDISKCRTEAESYTDFREKLPRVVDDILAGCTQDKNFTHIDYEPTPSRESVFAILDKAREILFPGYFNRDKLDPVNLKYTLGQQVSTLFDLLSDQVSRAIRYECFKYERPCTDCMERGYQIALAFLESVPALQKMLSTDIDAGYEGDPAAKSHDEVIFSYPGMFAITVYRIAHRLFELEVPLIPRMMTEFSHSLTGIDIHPGATIGPRFFIDHGTGVVIGETSIIGKNVRLYQGVTIGALSVPSDQCEQMRGLKRHPTIEDDVVIYSGATILGGETTIGTRCVIGGNVWVTESVPPDTTVIGETPKLKYRKT